MVAKVVGHLAGAEALGAITGGRGERSRYRVLQRTRLEEGMKSHQGIAGLDAAVDQRVGGCSGSVSILYGPVEVNRGAGVGGEAAGKRVIDGGSGGSVPTD